MYNLDLKEYGVNAFPNMMILAKYLSLGGGVILQYKGCKPDLMYYYISGEISNTPTCDTPIDISSGVIEVYTLMKSDKLERIGFFIDDVYKLFTTTDQLDRSVYIMNKHKEGMNLQRAHVLIKQEEFIKRITETKNNYNFDITVNEFNRLFDISIDLQQESALSVLQYNKSKMTGDSLDIPV